MTATAKKLLSALLSFVLVFAFVPAVALGEAQGAGVQGVEVLEASDVGYSADESATAESNESGGNIEQFDPANESQKTGVEEAASAQTLHANENATSESAASGVTATAVDPEEIALSGPDEAYVDGNVTFGYQLCTFTPSGGEAVSGVAIVYIRVSSGRVDVHVPKTITNGTTTYPVIGFAARTNKDKVEIQRDGVNNLYIPDSIRFVQDFDWIASVKESIVFEGNSPVTTLPNTMLKGYEGNSVTLPANLSAIPEELLWDSHITSITLPNAVKKIERRAFYKIGTLESVTLNEGLVTIGEEAFASAEGSDTNYLINGNFLPLKEVHIPSTVHDIDRRAFAKARSLQSLTFADNSVLDSIGAYAFWGTSLKSVALPDSVTTIENRAFSGNNGSWWLAGNAGDEYTLESVSLGDQNTSNLTTLGSEAFAHQPIKSIVLPNKLTSLGYNVSGYKFNHEELMQDGTMGAFAGCDKLETITWPTAPGLNTVGGFNDCTSLTAEAVNSIPEWVTRIDDYAFYNCVNMKDVHIPSTVTRIGQGAFSKSRVVSITGDAPVYTLTNANVELEGWTDKDPSKGPWPLKCGYTIRYPRSVGDDTAYSIVRYRNAVQAYEEKEGVSENLRTKFELVADTFYKVQGTVPAGASVRLYVDGTVQTPELDDANSFTSDWIGKGSMVGAVVSKEGYKDYVTSPESGKDAAEINEDWTFTVAALTPLSDLGILRVRAMGDNAADSNVAVFDHATGVLVSQGHVLRARMYVVDDIPAGSYDVVAWQKNDYFTRVSSIGDFAAMGFTEQDYARSTAPVVLAAGGIEEIELEIPLLDVSKISNVLAAGEVTVPSLYVAPGVPFVATISYGMKSGQPVNAVNVSIPKGLKPVAAASSTGQSHDVSAWTAPGEGENSSTLAIGGLEGAARQSGKISLALEATEPGSYAISASLTTSLASGEVVAPIGAANVECPAIRLVAPTDTLQSSTFTVHVYAAHGSTVQLKIGNTEVSNSCKPNLLGHATESITIPEQEMSFLPYYLVTATLVNDGTGEPGAESQQPSDTAIVQYNSVLQDVPLEPTVRDFWFESAGSKVVLSENSQDKSGGWYTVVPSRAAHSEIFSRSWPFEVTIDSLQPLEESVTLYLGMLDNSVKTYALHLAKTTSLPSGAASYTYRSMVTLSPDDQMDSSEIPCRFDVMPQFVSRDTIVQPELTAANMDALSSAIDEAYRASYQNGKDGFQTYLATFDAVYGSQAKDFKKCVTGECYGSADFGDTGFDLFAESADGKPKNDQYDFANGVFNESFRHTVWDPEGKIWKGLSSSDRQKLEEAEDQVAIAYDALQLLLGNKQPLYRYSSFEQYLSEEYGYTADGTFDPGQLGQQGYTVIRDANNKIAWNEELFGKDYSYELTEREDGADVSRTPKPGPDSSDSVWYAVSVSQSAGGGSGGLSAQGAGKLSALDTSAQDGDGSNATAVSSVWGDVHRTIIAFANANEESGAVNTVVGHALDAAGVLAGQLGPRAGGFITRSLGSAAALYFTIKGAGDSRASFDGVNSEYITRQAELERLIKMRDYYEDIRQREGKGKSDCQIKLEQEIDLMNTYLADLSRSRWISGVTGTVGALCGGVGAGAGLAAEGAFVAANYCAQAKKVSAAKVALGEAAICGTVSLACAAGGLINTMASYGADALLVPEIDAHKAAVKQHRYYREQECKKDDFGKLHYDKKPGIDPSGYTYEGVESNRVEGVLATIFQEIENEYKAWPDALEFEQVDHQNTTAEGLFAWDVPEGNWKVQFEKDGYKTIWSNIMHVLPEWTNVAINMLRTDAPEGVGATTGVDGDDVVYVDVSFNQYMKTAVAPAVTVDGTTISGAEWVGAQSGRDENGNEAQLSRTLRIPLSGLEAGQTVEVAISAAKSYADVAMANYTTTVTVPEAEVAYFFAGSSDEEAVAYVHGSGESLTLTFKRTVNDSKTFANFTGIQVDGAAVDATNYTAQAGSVIISLKASYLETLAEGEHTLTALFSDGAASKRFTVRPAAKPAAQALANTKGPRFRPALLPSTGDAVTPFASTFAFVAALAAVALMVSFMMANRPRRGKHAKK